MCLQGQSGMVWAGREWGLCERSGNVWEGAEWEWCGWSGDDVGMVLEGAVWG